MNFVIMHETVTNHDAIGNDIEMMSRIINRNHCCFVYACSRLNDNVDYIDDEELDRMLDDPETIVIYHHSVYWQSGYNKVKNAKGKVIFRYHNITPGHYFEPYNQFAFEQCKKGREQTEIMKRENPDAWWLADSEFNLEDLNLSSEEKAGICPPFNKIEEWSKSIPDETILQELIGTDSLNVLFVGRIVPNKGHIMLLEIIRAYCAYYDQKIKLRIVGKFDRGLSKYNKMILKKMKEYGISHLVEFIGEINDSTLMAYYLGSDVMLCCSEHEGFCVPVVEAQSFGVPVIALREGAVPETLGTEQLIFDNDIKQFAAALRRIRTDTDTRQLLGKIGINNYKDRFTFRIIQKQFENEMLRMTGVRL